MTNTIHIRTAFSFRGETHDLATTIDLDRCIGKPGDAPDFHRLLARAGGIDPYSYLYEVLEAQELAFSDPTGIAVHSCLGGAFDWVQFEQQWRDERDLEVLRGIAARTMGIHDLEAHDGLKAALLAAYRAGKEERP